MLVLLSGLSFGAIVSILGLYGWGVVAQYTGMSGTIEAQRKSLQSLSSRLAGAQGRIERRDDAIKAVGGACEKRVKMYIKEGPPSPFDPFNESGRS